MSKYSSSSRTAGKAIRFRTEVSAAAIYNEVEASGPDGRPGSPGRKVRTPQSSVPDNVRASSVKAGRRPVPQKTYRPAQAVVRVKRCGKSAPPGQQCSGHGKPHTEQDQIGREPASADTHRLGALEPPGRSHERGSNVPPRGMTVTPRKRNTEFGLQVHLPSLCYFSIS